MTNAPRLLTGIAAAAFLGIPRSTFGNWVAEGKMPPALPGRRYWDRKAIESAIDNPPGIPPNSGNAEESFNMQAKITNDIRIAAYMATRERLGELLSAEAAAKEKFETLLERDGGPFKNTLMMPDTVAAHAAHKEAMEAVFQQDELLKKERAELVELGLLKSRKKN